MIIPPLASAQVSFPASILHSDEKEQADQVRLVTEECTRRPAVLDIS